MGTSVTGWEGFGEGVERERAMMLSEFHHWVVKRRISVEQELLNVERNMADIVPFAQAGIDNAEAPEAVSLCVIEFARFSLRVLYLQRKLDLLNVYYRQAANEPPTVWLIAQKGDEAEVNELWEWFIHERGGK